MEAEDVESKYLQILQPLRDLAENWNIDIAHELEDYLESMESLSVTFDGGKTTVKFAEAALLIQGSTCIYSRKVEYLYSLVYHALELFTERRRDIASSIGQDGEDGDAQFRDRSQEFLPLDDVIEEGKRINLLATEPRFSSRRSALERSLASASMMLAPGRKGSSSSEGASFHLGRCSITSKGALVMEELLSSTLSSSAEMLDRFARGPGSFRESESEEAPPIDRMEVLPIADAVERCGPSSPSQIGEPSSEDDLPAMETLLSPRKSIRNSIVGTRVTLTRRESLVSLPPLDLFPLLDPFESHVHLLRPFRKGPRPRAPALEKSKLVHSPLLSEFSRLTIHSLPRPTPLYHKELKSLLRRRGPAGIQEESGPTANAVGTLFPNGSPPRMSSSRRASLRRLSTTAGLHESLEAPADATAPPPPEALQAEFGLGSDAEGGAGGVGDLPDISGGSEEEAWDGELIAPLASSVMGAIPPQPNSYEELVQQHLANFFSGSQKYLQESQLSQRVSEWTQQMEPKLEAEESRDRYDIHSYENAASLGLLALSGRSGTFPSILRSTEPFEICRAFLAVLQMANDGDIELIPGDQTSLDGSFLVQMRGDYRQKGVSPEKRLRDPGE